MFALAINHDRGLRRYALFEVPHETAERIEQLCKLDGFGREFNDVWAGALSEGKGYLADSEPVAGEALKVTPMSADQQEVARSYQLPLIEKASSGKYLRFWFGLATG
ncbi:MAG: hypothetical protein EOP85_09725 [Verrucomicrobiaceae bacterium]|nr:MAG: hypothetical protein EOP85_09725 [Verrucomicrobiaceae bacterium]